MEAEARPGLLGLPIYASGVVSNRTGAAHELSAEREPPKKKENQSVAASNPCPRADRRTPHERGASLGRLILAV